MQQVTIIFWMRLDTKTIWIRSLANNPTVEGCNESSFSFSLVDKLAATSLIWVDPKYKHSKSSFDTVILHHPQPLKDQPLNHWIYHFWAIHHSPQCRFGVKTVRNVLAIPDLQEARGCREWLHPQSPCLPKIDFVSTTKYILLENIAEIPLLRSSSHCKWSFTSKTDCGLLQESFIWWINALLCLHPVSICVYFDFTSLYTLWPLPTLPDAWAFRVGRPLKKHGQQVCFIARLSTVFSLKYSDVLKVYGFYLHLIASVPTHSFPKTFAQMFQLDSELNFQFRRSNVPMLKICIN